MSSSPGVQSAKLANTGPAALEGTVAINKINDFLSAGKETSFITYSEGQAGGKPSGRILFTIDRKTVPDLLAFLSAEASDYLTALMAPAILDEEISKTDYLSMVSSLYGQGIADEIKNSSIKATIDFPGPITSISGGTSDKNRADFEIPVLDLLVLEKPMSWEVVW